VFISVITVNYNDKVGLQGTVDSVLDQDFSDFEYIIIDGGSTDGSLDIIQSAEDRISHWSSGTDENIADAFNKGIKAANGDYILLLNAGDEFISTNDLTRCASKLDKAVVAFYGQYKDTRWRIPRQFAEKSTNLRQLAQLSHQATFVARQVYEDYGYYNLDYPVRMDYEFFLRVLPKVEIKFVEEVICVYDTGGQSGKPSFAWKFVKEGLLAEDRHLGPIRFQQLKLIWGSLILSIKLLIRPLVMKWRAR